MYWIVFIALGALFLALFLRERVQRADARSLIFKTLTSVCFLALALSGVFRLVRLLDASSWYTSAGGLTEVSLARGPVSYSLLVLAGLFFGLLGDIALDLKWNCRSEDVPYTYAGFWSFAIGHAFYLAALILTCRGGAGIAWILLPFAVSAVLGILIGVNEKLLKVAYGRFKPVVMFYAGILISTTLVSGSLALHDRFRNPVTVLFFIGGILFLVSDLILSGTYFGEGKDRPADIAANHIFYYAAQFVIAATILAA